MRQVPNSSEEATADPMSRDQDDEAIAILSRIIRLLDAGLTSRQVRPSIRQLERLLARCSDELMKDETASK